MSPLLFCELNRSTGCRSRYMADRLRRRTGRILCTEKESRGVVWTHRTILPERWPNAGDHASRLWTQSIPNAVIGRQFSLQYASPSRRWRVYPAGFTFAICRATTTRPVRPIPRPTTPVRYEPALYARWRTTGQYQGDRVTRHKDGYLKMDFPFLAPYSFL